MHLYHDPRTNGRTYGVIVFLGDDGEHGYSPECFSAQSEHITLEGGIGLCGDWLMVVTNPFRGVVTGWEGQS
jgi:hypothetical protein